MYRWHAAISQKDERWVEELFESAIGDKSVDEVRIFLSLSAARLTVKSLPLLPPDDRR